MYSLDDLRKKSGVKARKLELVPNIPVNIWIPKPDLCYHRIHFDVKKHHPKSKYNTLDCLNQTLGEEGKGCPICVMVKDLWADWKKTKDTNVKKDIQNRINQIVSEEYFFNGINIEEEDKFFKAIRFTRAKGLQILDTLTALETEAKKTGAKPKVLGDFIWSYGLTESGEGKKKKKDYSLSIIKSPELYKIAAALMLDYEKLANRPYEEGGLVDLDGTILRTNTLENYNAILEGKVEDESEEHESTEVSNEVIETEESTSLDSIESSSTDTTDALSTDTTESLEDSSTGSLDDLSLGSGDELGDLGLEEAEPPMVEITASDFKKEVAAKNMNYINAVIKHAIDSKLITDTKVLNTNVKTLYAYLNTGKTFKVLSVSISGVPF